MNDLIKTDDGWLPDMDVPIPGTVAVEETDTNEVSVRIKLEADYLDIKTDVAIYITALQAQRLASQLQTAAERSLEADDED